MNEVEPEIHVKDDGMEAHYSRKSLPSMGGQLQVDISGVVLEIDENSARAYNRWDHS